MQRLLLMTPVSTRCPKANKPMGKREMLGEGSDAIERAIAGAFVAARAGRQPLSAYPGPLPGSLAEAYRIQDAAVALRGGSIAGWKVGRIHPPASDRFGADRLAGPIFADQVQWQAADGNRMGIIDGGFAAAEAELLLKVGRSPDIAATLSLEDTEDCIESVHIGIEIASSPFPGINDLGPAVTVSDFGNNFGALIGPAVADWRDLACESWRVESRIDGVAVGKGVAGDMPDGILGSARFLFANLARRGIAIAPGSWISTGAISGVHPIRAGQHFEADFAPGLRIGCTVFAALSQASVAASATAPVSG